MWEKTVTYLTYKFKEAEFKYHTWRKARDIRKAYHTNRKIKIPNLNRFLPKAALWGGIAIAVFTLGFGLYKLVPAIPFTEITRNTQKQVKEFFRSIQQEQAAKKIQQATDQQKKNTTESGAEPEAVSVRTAAEKEPNKIEESSDISTANTPLIEQFMLSLPEQGINEHLLFADKSEKSLYLLSKGSGNWEIVRTYEMTTGEAAGQKEVDGDKKTPQGLYYIIGRKNESDLSEIYGPLAYVLDYPNEEDREAGRTGSGIWIHGTERDNSPPEPTRGCISLSNSDAEDLGTFLNSGFGVPVYITSGSGLINFDSSFFSQLKSKQQTLEHEYKNQVEILENLVMEWKDAWQSKDIELFSSFYHTEIFRSGRSDWNAFRENKIHTFRMYDWIEVTIDNFTLTELSQTEAIVKFTQIYQTNLNRFVNGKRLSFVKDGEKWKISREGTFPQQELFL